MNKLPASEYTTFVSAQLLRNWREQRPSNKGNLDSRITVKIGTIYYTEVGLLLISFFTVVLGLLFKWYALYKSFPTSVEQPHAIFQTDGCFLSYLKTQFKMNDI
jgi:hypothetical protein